VYRNLVNGALQKWRLWVMVCRGAVVLNRYREAATAAVAIQQLALSLPPPGLLRGRLPSK